MKKKKPNIRNRTIDSLHKRLDKIENNLTVFSFFSIFALVISIMFAVYALAIATNSLGVLWAGNILFLLAFLVFGFLIGSVIVLRLGRK